MDISLVNIFLLLIPCFLLIFSLKIFKVKVFKKSCISIFRMIIQLLLVGFYLEYIFKFNNPLINFAYIIIMIVVASFSVIDLVELNYKKLLLPIFASLFLAWVIAYSLYSNLVLVEIKYFNAQYIIPVSGMLLGNILKGQIIFLNNFFSHLKNNETSYFYLLSMGANQFEALNNFYKDAISASLKPDLANMATIGLVSLPGMMTGQILAGASPFSAIKYQISIMVAIFIVKMLSLFFTAFMTNKFCFDEFSTLKKDIFKINN